MKKIIFLLLAVISFASCECPYAEYDSYGFRENGGKQTKLTYNGDYFCADKLLGKWQCEYPMIVYLPEFGQVEFKIMDFKDESIVDISIVKIHDTDERFYTFSYAYTGKTLKFSRKGSTISFSFENYIWPQVFLRDSFGRYTMKKIGAYGC
jgi:hypothetical protein